jgi:hypothetical protein
MSMNWIWCPNHNLQHIACEKPSESPTALLPPWGETKRWGGICMATNNSRRCWNTLYMYEADLLWVWFGWAASIITYNMIHLMLVNVEAEAYQVLPSPPLTLRDLIFSVGSIYFCQLITSATTITTITTAINYLFLLMLLLLLYNLI